MEISLWFLSTTSLESVRLIFYITSVLSSIIREQEIIDVERRLRYDFMWERCQKEMPEERK